MTVALILSGGSGTRLGTNIPKQYIKIYGRSVISYCIVCLSGHDGIEAVQVVAAPLWHETIRECLDEYDKKGKFHVGCENCRNSSQLSIIFPLKITS